MKQLITKQCKNLWGIRPTTDEPFIEFLNLEGEDSLRLEQNTNQAPIDAQRRGTYRLDNGEHLSLRNFKLQTDEAYDDAPTLFIELLNGVKVELCFLWDIEHKNQLKLPLWKHFLREFFYNKSCLDGTFDSNLNTVFFDSTRYDLDDEIAALLKIEESIRARRILTATFDESGHLVENADALTLDEFKAKATSESESKLR